MQAMDYKSKALTTVLRKLGYRLDHFDKGFKLSQQDGTNRVSDKVNDQRTDELYQLDQGHLENKVGVDLVIVSEK